MEPGESPKLTIELVPQTCWFSNVRDQVSRGDWDRIRSQVSEKAGRRCEVCGGRGNRHPVECHEVWEYDEQAGVQRLIRMVALCPACHEVKHIGLAGIRGRGEIARDHLARVNDWAPEVAARYVNEAFDLWRMRSRRNWSLDISSLAAYGINPAVIADAANPSGAQRSRRVASVSARKARPPRPR
jgi:hypothetical protein